MSQFRFSLGRLRLCAVLVAVLSAPLTLSADEGILVNDACALDGTCCPGNPNEICVPDGSETPVPGKYWKPEPGKCPTE